ncbi:MAG: family N-acetyltransferase [Acidimicrobiaceae bacterium]|nr:family N-acetyltransferase [Acidimicrobiaceae bacterium]
MEEERAGEQGSDEPDAAELRQRRDWADDASGGLAAAYRALGQVLPAAWIQVESGFVYGVTGAPAPFMNGVFGARPGVEAAVLERCLDQVAVAGLPYCLELRPGAGELEAMALERGMSFAEEIPLMVRPNLRSPDPVQPELVWRRARPGDEAPFLDLQCRGFEAPPEVMGAIVVPELLNQPFISCLMGAVDGEWVTTAIAIVVGEALGVFNVATPPEHRRKGYASAITARCLAFGEEAGGRFAFLQSSEDAFGAYRRMGFVPVEAWRGLVAEP